MEKKVEVYHSTNLSVFEEIKKCGYIGLDKNNYLKISEKIITLTGTKVSKEKLMEKFFDKESSESNGGVSFFQDYDSCHKIANLFNEGGEWLNLFIKSSLKYISRVEKVPYNELKIHLNKFFEGNTEPVILKFEIPEEIIVNKNKIGTTSELYTNEKVSMNYFVCAYNKNFEIVDKKLKMK